MEKKIVEPPKHLSERSKALWCSVTSSRTPLARLVAIEQALNCLDQSDAARAIVEREGMMVPGRAMEHAHPLLKVIETNRKQFFSVWSALELMSREPPTVDEMIAEIKAANGG